MLSTVEGVISRRVLLNYRVDPEVAQRLVPDPLRVAERDGFAVAGVCLIRLEHLRPKGLPAAVGIASENAAHRIAITYPGPDGQTDGVFIWRRDTDRALVTLLGGRAFPGVHHRARFAVEESNGRLDYRITTPEGDADIALDVRYANSWAGTTLFPAFDEVRDFFARGDCGFSCSLRGDRLEGIRLRTVRWDMEPLTVESISSSFFSEPSRFPPGSIELDGAVLMRGVPHEWHELRDVPEMASLGSSS